MGMRRGRTNKNPPVFSHEFVIQNHADIVSCIAMVFVIGLMFQATSPVASMFVTPQYNITVNNTNTEAAEEDTITLYSHGFKDLFTIFFYLLICIVIHAVIQEYILDKLNRKMHLSKVKHSKFNESGQLMVFYFGSAAWGADTIIREGLTSIGQLWEGYPHSQLSFMFKFYFIIQLAYWLHNFPELYFQKVKKDEIQGRVQYTVLYLVFITAAYVLNLNRIAICLMVLHCAVETVFHLARLIYFADKVEIANTVFMVFNVLFVLVRLGTITLAVLTFWYGLQQTGQDSLDFATGNFNTKLVRYVNRLQKSAAEEIRINCLAATCLLQAWMMWNFITFHLKRLREKAIATRKMKSPMKKRGKVAQEDDISNLPEVDQNTAQNGSLRSRKQKK